LLRSGKKAEAVAKLEEGAALDERDANIQYNLGLAYFDVGQYEKALKSAHRAYAAGFPLPGLREKLKRAGKWRAP
jgi:tetratricopeptide (TPR) repeat protein